MHPRNPVSSYDRVMPRGSTNERATRRVWDEIAPGILAYDLVLPGAHSFICRAQTCNAWCCRALSVPLDDPDVHRLHGSSNLAPEQFIECIDGEPIVLPLLQPYLLARSGGSCALLGSGLACACYDGRPDACRAYPFQVLFADVETARLVQPDEEKLLDITVVLEEIGGATGSLVIDRPFIPLLVRHRECPGFTGPRLTVRDWAGLVRATAALQYPRLKAGAALDGESFALAALMGKPASS